MKKGGLLFSVVMLANTLGVPLMAQTMMLKANIPFEFMVGKQTLPAGEYIVRNDGDSPVLRLQSDTGHAAAVTLTLAHREFPFAGDPAGYTKLTFNRYGTQYFLSEVDNGYLRTGFVLPMSLVQREAAKTASMQREEVFAVLAQR